MIINIFHRVDPDMTNRAIQSVRDAGFVPKIIDNSDNFDFRSEGSTRLSPKYYSFAAMHNWMCDTLGQYFWMHNDVVAPKETFEALKEAVQRRKENTGIVFADYDRLCWFNCEAIRDAGWWDLKLPQYYSDNDIYRRVGLKGWEIVDLNLPLTHDASATLQDPQHRLLNNATFDLYGAYYARKWGGLPPYESYKTPFNQ
jgi:GT2 family glycosyltransferase